MASVLNVHFVAQDTIRESEFVFPLFLPACMAMERAWLYTPATQVPPLAWR